MTIINAKTRVTIGGLVEGDPPMLAYHKIATRPDGKRKLFSQRVQVIDPDLLARVRREARNGEEAEVVIEQRLGNGITSVLLDFTALNTNPSLGLTSATTDKGA